MVTEEHDCLYRARHDAAEAAEARVAELEQKVELLAAANAKLNKQLYGKQSERMPSVSEVLSKEKRDRDDPKDNAAKREKTRAVRKANAEARSAAAVEEHAQSYVDDDARICPSCSGDAKTISSKKSTTTVVYVNGYFKNRIVHRETVACSCGQSKATQASTLPRLQPRCSGSVSMTRRSLRFSSSLRSSTPFPSIA